VLAQQALADRVQLPIQSSSKEPSISASQRSRRRPAVAWREAIVSTLSGRTPEAASRPRRRANSSVLPVPGAPAISSGPAPCATARSRGVSAVSVAG